MASSSPKQELFIREYLVDLNGTQAAIRAGYSPHTANEQASRLLANVNIASRVQELMDERAKKVNLSAQYVIEGIKRVTERCEQVEPVRDRDGNETGEYQFNAAGALKGYELLGKHLKLFTEKTEVEHSGSVRHAIEMHIIDPDENGDKS